MHLCDLLPKSSPSVKAVVRSELQFTTADNFTDCGLNATGCNLLVCDGIERALCNASFPNGCDDDNSVAVTCNPDTVRRTLTSDAQDTKSVIASAAAGPGRRLQTELTYQYDFTISFTVACTQADCSDTDAIEASANATLAGLDASLTNFTGADVSAGIADAIDALSATDRANLVNGFTVYTEVDEFGSLEVFVVPDSGIPGFKQLGSGECEDQFGNEYSYFQYVPNSIANEKARTDTCIVSDCFNQNPNWILRAVQFEYYAPPSTTSSRCYCNFEGGETGDTCEAGSGLGETFTGELNFDFISGLSKTGTGVPVTAAGGGTNIYGGYFCLAYDP